jgi:exodeoxyribonuclease-3
MKNLSIFIWNIANPSLERARKQAEWIHKRKEDVFVLTEIKTSRGCLFLKKYFEAYRYYILFPDIEDKEYGSMIVSKIPLLGGALKYMDFLPSRVMWGKLSFFDKDIEVVSAYVPSRDASEKKIKKKKLFLQAFLDALQKSNLNNPRIICGDFNVLEPNHNPHYPFFKDWEYDFYNRLSQYQLSDAWRFLHPSEL